MKYSKKHYLVMLVSLMMVLLSSSCFQNEQKKVSNKQQQTEKGSFVTITYDQSLLPYDFNALEPYLDARTVEIHYTKHHKGYVEKLRAALEKHPELFAQPIEALLCHLEQVPEDIRLAVRNQGGGHWAHEFFWHCMAPAAVAHSLKNEQLQMLFAQQFGSFEGFKKEFEKTALGLFGSGWTWLVFDPKKASLGIVTTPNHDLPQRDGLIPLLVLDVWEHAYYLKFQNRRAEFVEQWWHVVNWDFVGSCFDAAMK